MKNWILKNKDISFALIMGLLLAIVVLGLCLFSGVPFSFKVVLVMAKAFAGATLLFYCMYILVEDGVEKYKKRATA